MLGKRGSLMIILRGIPGDLTRRELKAFIKQAVKTQDERSFFLRASVGSCTIVRITDPSSGDAETHGLVEVQPAKAAIRTIEALDGKEWMGRKIEVRRYHDRSLLRDHRKRPDASETPDSRQTERRRKNLKIDLVDM